LVFADGERQQHIQPFAEELGIDIIATRNARGGHNYADLLQAGGPDTWPNVDIDTDDDFAIIYSSGTSGNPKGVVLTHRSALSSVYSRMMAQDLAPMVMDPPPPKPPE